MCALVVPAGKEPEPIEDDSGDDRLELQKKKILACLYVCMRACVHACWLYVCLLFVHVYVPV